ncbi:hypothetical protein Nepgr_027711 [Nepenthes gracilis]|uniref:Uncharacterized protein n=1 Tax=Nepenthes gracilis TaxID=150966 RepID=A0AAD3TB15_NEPGR|nr:hypothetical protein Nepgr_027711 [Nepenthes gracilis]
MLPRDWPSSLPYYLPNWMVPVCPQAGLPPLQAFCIFASGCPHPGFSCSTFSVLVPATLDSASSDKPAVLELLALSDLPILEKMDGFGRTTYGSLVLPVWCQANVAHSPAASVRLPWLYSSSLVCRLRRRHFADGQFGRIARGSMVLPVRGLADVVVAGHGRPPGAPLGPPQDSACPVSPTASASSPVEAGISGLPTGSSQPPTSCAAVGFPLLGFSADSYPPLQRGAALPALGPDAKFLEHLSPVGRFHGPFPENSAFDILGAEASPADAGPDSGAYLVAAVRDSPSSISGVNPLRP